MSEFPKKIKKRRLKPRVIDILCTISGIVIGYVIALLTENIGFLKWLSYDVVFGFEKPIEFTVVIFKFALGFSIHLTPAVVLFALLGFVASRFLLAPKPKKEPATLTEDELNEYMETAENEEDEQ